VSYLSLTNSPNLHLVHPLGVTLLEFHGDLLCQKSVVPALSCGVVFMTLCSAVQYNAGLRWTDGDIDDSIYPRSELMQRKKRWKMKLFKNAIKTLIIC